MRTFARQLVPATLALAVFTLLLGLGYPLVVLAAGQGVFGHRADGSLIVRDGVVVGSELLGQPFRSDRYFHPRPSAAGEGYDGRASSGSNLGPSSAELAALVTERVAAYRAVNVLAPQVAVPVDAVTASASGLDPHISIANAKLQAARVARARGLTVGEVQGFVIAAVDDRPLGLAGDPGVNVVRLNVALDDRSA